MTEPSDLIKGLLIFSAVAVGLGSFFVGTAANYSIDNAQLNDFADTFNHYASIDAKLQAMQEAIMNTQVLNPLTWGNVVSLVVNFFAILFELPGLLHQIITDMVMTTSFLPGWVIWLVEGLVLTTIVFGAIAAINKWRS